MRENHVQELCLPHWASSCCLQVVGGMTRTTGSGSGAHHLLTPRSAFPLPSSALPTPHAPKELTAGVGETYYLLALGWVLLVLGAGAGRVVVVSPYS